MTSAGDFSLINRGNKKLNVLLLLCLLLYFANFRSSRTVLVVTAFIKNSLSSTYTHINSKKSLATVFNRRLISIYYNFTAGKTTQSYTKKIPTEVYIRASIFTSLLCLSGAWISGICLLWLGLLTFYNLHLISRQKPLWALLGGDNCSMLFAAVSFPAL